MSKSTKKSLNDQFATFKRTGDFLQLTLANEDVLDMRYSFVINGQSPHHTQVNIVSTGVIVFAPINTKTQDEIIISCGIHGDETAPIELCASLIQAIVLAKIKISARLMFIFGNPPAINQAKRFINVNLNTLFSGAHKQGANNEFPVCFERLRAQQLETLVEQFFCQDESNTAKNRLKKHRVHYDLHTSIRGSIYEKFAIAPYRGKYSQPFNQNQLNFLADCGVSALLVSMTPTTAFTYFGVSQFNTEAFTIELGKVALFGQNNLDDFNEVTQTLTRLISLPCLTSNKVYIHRNNQLSAKAKKMKYFKVNQVIHRKNEDFSFNFDDKLKNFTAFEPMHLLACDGRTRYLTECEEEAVIFPNKHVAIGQRALLTVVPIELNELMAKKKRS